MDERIGQRALRPHGERANRGELLVQRAAATVLAAGLDGDSAFIPGEPVWTTGAADELAAAVAPDPGKAPYLQKLQTALEGCSMAALHLAAELQYLSFLPLHDMKGEKKRERVQSVRRWADLVKPIPGELDAALDSGVFNGGMGYTVQGWPQLRIFVSFVQTWTSAPASRRDQALRDPWAFRDLVQSVPGPNPAAQRFALMYLAYPDVFEPIINSDHRKKIAKALMPEVGPTTGDEDRDLLAIRHHFETSTGEPFDFYRPSYAECWKPTATLVTPAQPPGVVRRAWLIRGSSVQGVDLVPRWLADGWVSLAASQLPELDLDADRAMIKDLVDEYYAGSSYAQRQQKLEEVQAFLSRMQLGDVVLTTSQGEFYLGEVTGSPSYDGTDTRARLRREVTWRNQEQGIDLSELTPALAARVQNPADVQELTAQLADLDLLLGDDDPTARAAATLPDATPELAAELLLPQEWLQECIELLRDRPQLVLYGPPGTGKTYVARRLATHLAGQDGVTLVQLHPAYSYEDFFEGYRPEPSEGGTVGFRLKPGPFRRVVEQAREHPEKIYVLVVDEMNRGNLARVFGELYFLLEYRDQAIDLLYARPEDQAFTLPANVVLIGTMNTADRSIALVDAAMRRRFSFVALHPGEEPVRGLLGRWLAAQGRSEEPAQLLALLNDRIDDLEFKVGPSYLMRSAVYEPGGLERVWRRAIEPLLEEHHYGETVDLHRRYGLAALRAALQPVEASPEPMSPEPVPAVEDDGDAEQS